MAKKETTKAIASPAVIESQMALASMTPALRALYDKVSKKIGELAKSDIMTKYDIGKDIDTAMTDKRKYGEEGAIQLAAALNTSATNIYDLARLFNAFKGKRDELKAIVDKQTTNGGHISYSHLIAVCNLPESKRQKYLNIFFKECLTVRDLAARIQEELGIRSNGGKKRTLPRSPEGGLSSMTKVLDNLTKAHEDIQVAIFDKIDESPTEHAKDELISKLEALNDSFTEAARLLEEDQRKVAVALETLHRVQRFADNKATTDAEFEEHEEDSDDDGGTTTPSPRRAPEAPLKKKKKKTMSTPVTKKVMAMPTSKVITITEENADGKVLSKVSKPASTAAMSVAERIAAAKAMITGPKRAPVRV